jgi:hypothetical protein
MLSIVLWQDFAKQYAFRMGESKKVYGIHANKGKRHHAVPVRTQVNPNNLELKRGGWSRNDDTIALQDRRDVVLGKIIKFMNTLEENTTLPLDVFLDRVGVAMEDYLLGRRVDRYGLLPNPLHEVNMVGAFKNSNYRCWRVVDPETNDEFVFMQVK